MAHYFGDTEVVRPKRDELREVEGLDEIYHIKALYWRRAEATTYMDILDAERKTQNRTIIAKSGSLGV